jgi:hypothetical protein
MSEARPAPFARTPNAERYLLESDNLRRRQLRSALLHGSTRVWRERQRVWPAVLVGIIVVAVTIAAIAVAGAFQRQREITEQERRKRQSAPAAVVIAGPDRSAAAVRATDRGGAGWVPQR